MVIGAPNEKAGSAGTIINLLEEPRFTHQVEVTRDVLADESSVLLKSFFKELRIRNRMEKKIT